MSEPSQHTTRNTTLPEAAALRRPDPAALHLELLLHRQSSQDDWWAELRSIDGAPPLLFASLPALIGFIARLDRPAQPGGLR